MSQIDYSKLSDQGLKQYFKDKRDKEALSAYLERVNQRNIKVITTLDDPDFDAKIQAAIEQKIQVTNNNANPVIPEYGTKKGQASSAIGCQKDVDTMQIFLKDKGIVLEQPTSKEIHQDLTKQIEREDGLMATRIQWLLIFQGFLFTAFVNVAKEPLTSSTSKFLPFILVIAGVAVAFVAWLGIRAAAQVLIILKKEWQNIFRDSAYIQPFGYYELHEDAVYYAQGIPVIISVVWILILVGKLNNWL